MNNNLMARLRHWQQYGPYRPSRYKEAADRIENLEAALIAIKAMHHDGGIDNVEERDDRTYCMVCDALEGKDD